jgi:hypothetical protein
VLRFASKKRIAKMRKIIKTMIVLLFAIMVITGLTTCQARNEDLSQRELSASIIGGEGGSVAPLFATGYDGEKVNFFVNKKVGYDYDSVFVNGVGRPFTIAIGNVFPITIEGVNYDIRFKFKKNNQWFLMGTWKLSSSFARNVGATEWEKIPNSFHDDTYSFSEKMYSIRDSSGHENGNGEYKLLEPDSLIIGANPQGYDGSRYKMLVIQGKEMQLELTRLDKYYLGTVRVPSKDEKKLFIFVKK